ncbi:MAG: hypothetical protein GXY32_04705 [Ruminococcaceae bacterium]|nr:hypothetical protein [Oscillospiraceae bacterium]
MDRIHEPAGHKHAVFALAHTDVRVLPIGGALSNGGRTLRLIVKSNVRAHHVEVVFSNKCGTEDLHIGAASLAACDEAGNLFPDTLVPLTVDGIQYFRLEPGQDGTSDVCDFAFEPGNHFALNIYYPKSDHVQSGNWVGNRALRSKPGNYAADPHLSGPHILSRFVRTVVNSDFTVPITSVSQIIAHSPAPARVIGCFGDSITQQSNWTGPFYKLLCKRYPGAVSLCNLGIGGNRLLYGSPAALGQLNGEAGVARFKHDLLGLTGLTHAILALGTNDIGLPGAEAPVAELITPEAYEQAMRGMARHLHERGVKVYAATLCPRVLAKSYTAPREELRQQMNTFIRTAECFDGVLDFDRALRRADGKPGMKQHCALPDGLHPSPFGGLVMAKSIDLALFNGDVNG